MPIRGESVGTAYVRILADGTGFPSSLRRELKGSGRDAGVEVSDEFRDAVREEMEGHNRDSLAEAFQKSLVLDKAVKDFFNGPDWAESRKEFETQFGSLGREAANNMEMEFVKKGKGLSGIESEIESIGARVNKLADQRLKLGEKESARLRKISEDFHRSLTTIDADSDRAGNALTRFFARFRSGSRDVDKDQHVFSRLGEVIDKVALGVGRAFGKGSRNDFLNFSGSFIQHSIEILGIFPKLIGNLGEFRTGFTEALQAGEGFSGFLSALAGGFKRMSADAEGAEGALSGLFSSVPTLLAAIPVLVAALAGVVLVLSTVAALISGITAALIAMVATVGFAISSILAPLLGLIAPLAIAVGGLVAGIIAMQTHTKELQKVITPVIDQFKELGKVAETGFLSTFDIGKGVATFTTAMKSLAPVVREVGAEFGTLATNITEAFSSPFAQHFIDVMTTFVPRVLESLGRSLANVGDAFAHLFLDAIPETKRFLSGLEDITGEFDQWVRQNPGPIKQFFREAGESAHVLLDFVGKIGQAIGILIGAGRKTGDTIFTDLTKQAQAFIDFIKPQRAQFRFDEAGRQRQPTQQITPPVNRLQDFFKFGLQTARDLGNIAKAVADIFRALDNKEGRDTLHVVLVTLTGIGKLAPVLATIASLTFDAVTDLINLISDSSVAEGIRFMAGAVQKLADALDDLSIKGGIGIHAPGLGSLGGVFSSIGNALIGLLPGLGPLSRFGDTLRIVRDTAHGAIGIFHRIRDALSNLSDLHIHLPHIDLSHIFGGTGGGLLTIKPPNLDWVPRVINRIQGIAPAVAGVGGNILGKFATAFGTISSKAGTLAGNVAQKIASIPGRLGGIAAQFGRLASTWAAAVLSRISDLPQQIVDEFLGLGKRIIDAIGPVVIHVGAELVGGAASLLSKAGEFVGGLKPGAEGGIFAEPTPRLIGEAGPEALVPLTRPLNQVDPSVRWLAALARGQSTPGSAQPARVINNTFQITQAGIDPVTAANEFLTRLTASVI